MIPLDTQIKIILFSFLYGVFFSLFLDFNDRFMMKGTKYKRIIYTSLVILISILIYFIGLMKISYGILHLYGILCIIIGYCLTIYAKQRIAKKYQK